MAWRVEGLQHGGNDALGGQRGKTDQAAAVGRQHQEAQGKVVHCASGQQHGIPGMASGKVRQVFQVSDNGGWAGPDAAKDIRRDGNVSRSCARRKRDHSAGGGSQGTRQVISRTGPDGLPSAVVAGVGSVGIVPRYMAASALPLMDGFE